MSAVGAVGNGGAQVLARLLRLSEYEMGCLLLHLDGASLARLAATSRLCESLAQRGARRGLSARRCNYVVLQADAGETWVQLAVFMEAKEERTCMGAAAGRQHRLAGGGEHSLLVSREGGEVLAWGRDRKSVV